MMAVASLTISNDKTSKPWQNLRQSYVLAALPTPVFKREKKKKNMLCEREHGRKEA